MGKDIIIQEGGVGRQMTADKLRTNLAGGGSCLWVPEDEVKLGTKTIRENGTFYAADDGYYGYSRVTVKGVGVATGRKGDGRQYAVSADGDGKLVETLMPESIRITALPDVLEYGDRAYINFDGLAVEACDALGEAMYPVPFEALVFPVTLAELGERSAILANVSAAGTHLAQWRTKTSGSNVTTRTAEKAYDGPAYTVMLDYDRWFVPALIAPTFDAACKWVRQINADGEVTATWFSEPADKVDGYYINTGFATTGELVESDQPAYGHFETWDDAVADLLGRIAAGDFGGGQSIPVQWARPGDGAVLETSFSVSVIPAGGHGED